ncbi:apolipoprotein N-acyltransferase [Wigglesworthia glossinidia endosymbiont of Glossina morsitans morsitans (Yale colony)]|uniref:Apolipoprotein N-acyltransferase n=1 Tax=Wigglesworthia glossinidia endosymbiont of Glossina morsitans morsitans (Yale colony) TaxID=1142511 RepID=H6Q5V5_WIGGL|nr:apolipoprotein N-acyltransferase [Wigglesworthia glossinidia]AFA41151.1 apolipoprotein N-acyltransferase [Wigglesworthia glossinidia endosymbiont of Glossina morsitans morsitans (Yale colony)]
MKYDALIIFIFGILNTISFSPYDFWPASIFSIFGLLVIINKYQYWKKIIFLGFIWGIGNFFSSIYWIYFSIYQFFELSFLISIFLVFVLSVYLSLYPMIFVLLLQYFCTHINLKRFLIGAPSIWFFTEFLRGKIFTGFPWLELGYSQIDGPLKGIAPIFGVSGISCIIIIISGLISLSWTKKEIFPLILSFSILIILYPLNFLKWYTFDKQYIKIALVQGNVPQSLYFDNNQVNLILKKYMQITEPFLKVSKIIIWPESAIPCYDIICDNFLMNLDRKLKLKNSILITGITSFYQSGYYNSIMLLGNDQSYEYNLKHKYNKHYLVPFGETLPIKNFFQPILKKFGIFIFSLQRGKYLQPQLNISNFHFTPSICYEIIFSEKIRNNVQSNTDFLLTISNDIWFGNTIGPWQHLQMARMRALETGKTLLRSSNNGITAIINPDGTLKSKLPQFVCDVLFEIISPSKGVTPYVFFGSMPIWIIVIIFFIYSIIYKFKLVELFEFFMKTR